jgi:hypothetical protein
LEGLKIDAVLKSRIEALIKLKATVGEGYLHNDEADVLAFIKENIEIAEAHGCTFLGNKKDIDMDKFFLSIIKN